MPMVKLGGCLRRAVVAVMQTAESCTSSDATDCFFHYSSSHGYFIPSQNGSGIETDSLMPRVRCEKDGIPMYFAEVLPGKKSFRLWKCPKCGMHCAVKGKARYRGRKPEFTRTAYAQNSQALLSRATRGL
jgi:hypothetical protein